MYACCSARKDSHGRTWSWRTVQKQ
jgi:hypothetical protein